MNDDASAAPSGPRSADRALYTARVDNVGGTSGQVHVHEAPTAGIEISHAGPGTALALPTGGPSAPGEGFTPEQFLAMAWSTCLGETLRVVLAERALPQTSSVSVEVGLHRDPGGGYRFAPRARVTITGTSPERAQEIAEAAHARCPVSKLLTGQGEPVLEVHTTALP